jgi:Na+-transporting NADH:ubiquinone oxidoreductase subunit NqrF
MLITRKSPVTESINTIEIDITEAQLESWKAGTLIQVAMPGTTAAEREFIMTGLTVEDWETLFGSDDE